MNYRILKLLVPIGALIIIVLAVSFVMRPRAVNWTAKTTVPASFATTQPLGNNSLLLANGRSFVDYNYVTGHSDLLSADTVPSTLNGSDTLSASANHQLIIFHKSVAMQGSLLYTALLQRGLDPASDYWWIYDRGTQIFQAFPAGTVLAKFSGDKAYAISSKMGEEELTQYDVHTLSPVASFGIPGSTDFFVTSRGYILQTPDDSLLLTRNGSVSQTLATHSTALGVLPDGQTLVASSVTNNQQNLFTLRMSTGAQKVIANNISSQPAMAQDGTVLYTKSSGDANSANDFYEYDAGHKKTFPITLSEFNDSVLRPVALLDGQTAVVSDASSNYFLVGKDVHRVAVPSSSYGFSVSAANTTVVLVPSGDRIHTLEANLDGQSGDEQTAIYRRIRQDGYNPDLLTILFTIPVGSSGGE